jgi:hypothetical protein
MFYLHQENSFGNTLWFVPVNWQWFPGSNSTKSAASGADISQDHKSGCSRAPALTHIWTVATLADCMKFMLVYQAPDLLKTFSYW